MEEQVRLRPVLISLAMVSVVLVSAGPPAQAAQSDLRSGPSGGNQTSEVEPIEAKTTRRADGIVPVARTTGRPVPGQYIVQVRRGANPRAVANEGGASPRFVYESALNGFAAELNAGQLHAAQRNPNVTFIQEDSYGRLNATQTLNDSGLWGLDRIDRRSGRNNTYDYNSTGAGVTAYVIDDGIDPTHPEFGDRARKAYDVTGGSGTPCGGGHGTHVAATIGGKTYGVAKSVQIRGVKAYACGSVTDDPTLGQTIKAVDWVRADAKAKGRPAVANISLGFDRAYVSGSQEDLMVTAVTNLSNSGVFVAVAAGNENQDACNVVPAAAPAAVTVAATDRYDNRASYTNWGDCVDLYAPGSGVKSAVLNHGSGVKSGTSMASPHVAGVAALYKGAYGQASSAAVWNGIRAHTTNGVVAWHLYGPNRLLYQKTNPYSARRVCGDSYTTQVHSRDLAGKARVYLLYSPTTGYNCAVTIKTTRLGDPSKTEVWLIKSGDAEWKSNIGEFQYYAGPVKRHAPGSCVQYAGGHDGTNWTSGLLGCG